MTIVYPYEEGGIEFHCEGAGNLKENFEPAHVEMTKSVLN